MTAIRGAKIPNGYRFEYDLMQDVRERLNRKIEIDGEKALELALAEVGYVKERTCHIEYHYGEWYCNGCGHMVGTCDTASELYIDGNAIELWKHCPNCGARVIGADE